MGPRAAGPAGPAGPVVLVVEDDPGVAALLADVLAGAGYAPATTASALGAAALARRLRPAAVLLDLGLPYRSGGALLGDLKADPATAAIPVLVVSALADALPPARRALAAGVVAKPFSPAALLAAVRGAYSPTAPAGAGGQGPAAVTTSSPRRRPGVPPPGPPALGPGPGRRGRPGPR
jgi:DNA-binding response OmpR family regulator